MKKREFAILKKGEEDEKIYLDECENHLDILKYRKNRDGVDLRREIIKVLEDEFYNRTELIKAEVSETNIPELQ